MKTLVGAFCMTMLFNLDLPFMIFQKRVF